MQLTDRWQVKEKKKTNMFLQSSLNVVWHWFFKSSSSTLKGWSKIVPKGIIVLMRCNKISLSRSSGLKCGGCKAHHSKQFTHFMLIRQFSDHSGHVDRSMKIWKFAIFIIWYGNIHFHLFMYVVCGTKVQISFYFFDDDQASNGKPWTTKHLFGGI